MEMMNLTHITEYVSTHIGEIVFYLAVSVVFIEMLYISYLVITNVHKNMKKISKHLIIGVGCLLCMIICDKVLHISMPNDQLIPLDKSLIYFYCSSYTVLFLLHGKRR